MSASQPRVAVSPVQENLLRPVLSAPREESWWARFWRKEVLIMQPEAKSEYAQRWPAPAIASLVSSGVAVIVVVMFSLLTMWTNTSKDTSTAFSDLKVEVTTLKGDNRLLQSEIDRLKADATKTERDLNLLKLKLRLDLDDGTIPKEK